MDMRTSELRVLVTEGEKAIVQKHCKRRGETVSDYGRSAILASMVMDGSGDALRLLADSARSLAKRRLEEWTVKSARVA